MISYYDLFREHELLVDKALEFFLTKILNPDKYKHIVEICIANNPYSKTSQAHTLMKIGYLTAMDFAIYVKVAKEWNSGVKVEIIERLLEIMAEKVLMNPSIGMMNVANEKRYKPNDIGANLYRLGLIKNKIFGFEYIIEKYKNSVFKIEHIAQNDDHSIGTGFLWRIAISPKHNFPFIVTNKHVVEKHKKLNVFDSFDNPIGISMIITDEMNDIAFILMVGSVKNFSFLHNNTPKIISSIITIGYPSVPMTNQAYQVCHRGEVNSFVEDYHKTKLFLFSAKTSSGNSGSPVIDENGTVIGMVTEELFEKDKFLDRGKLPYYAAIPFSEIVKSFKKNVEPLLKQIVSASK